MIQEVLHATRDKGQQIMDGAGHRDARVREDTKHQPTEPSSVDGEKQAESPRSIVWLGETDCHNPFLVGGKAASLSRLAEHSPVPPGFSLTTAAFDRGQGVDAITTEIASAYTLLGERCGLANPPVAVRSSAVDEDGTDASFAGQHETFLNIIGVDFLLRTVRDCWASFHTPHAMEYRRKQGLPIDGVRVAVLVQQLVVADVSAVVFTADPVTGSRDQIVINASWGLGESIVGGTVTPDTYRVGKVDMSVLSRHISDKRHMTVAGDSGTPEVEVPSFLRSRAALDDEQVIEMARLGRALDDASGRPVDIECEFRSDRLYLLQCRPITTLGSQAAADGEV